MTVLATVGAAKVQRRGVASITCTDCRHTLRVRIGPETAIHGAVIFQAVQAHDELHARMGN